MNFKLVFFFILALFLAGCDYQFREKVQTEDNKNQTNQNSNNQTSSTNSTSNAGNSATKETSSNEPLILTGTGENTTFPCNGREVEVVADSTANNYKFTGECKKLTVDGVSNKIIVEKVGEISVKGTSNKVTYTDGLDGKKPKITKSGVSTEVISQKETEAKQKAESK